MFMDYEDDNECIECGAELDEDGSCWDCDWGYDDDDEYDDEWDG